MIRLRHRVLGEGQLPRTPADRWHRDTPLGVQGRATIRPWRCGRREAAGLAPLPRSSLRSVGPGTRTGVLGTRSTRALPRELREHLARARRGEGYLTRGTALSRSLGAADASKTSHRLVG